jgi:hypothetical protein
MPDSIPQGSIFVRTDRGLAELREAAYDSEAILQQLLAEYPRLLAGDQMDTAAPRRLVLVQREMGVPGEERGAGRWSLDHLFLDQDGVPTLIEVKRSSDTRLRREVVGQMLDYAANAVVFWPIEGIRAAFEATCNANGIDPDEALRELVDDEEEPGRYWATVQTNLQAGRVRMVFVADVVPTELRRVIEFLNQQMSPAEVLALEVKQFVGEGLQTLVPRVVGQTAAAQLRKRTSSGGGKSPWDEDSFFDAIAQHRPPAEVAAARRMLEWARARDLRIWWGRGKATGSFFPMLDLHRRKYFSFSVWTDGRIDLQLLHMHGRPAVPDQRVPQALLAELRTIPGIDLGDDVLGGRPSVPLAVVADASATDRFLAIFDGYISRIRSFDWDPSSDG